MNTRPRLLLLASLALLLGAFAMPGFSGATFTARTSGTASISASNDWTPPVVAMTAPASAVSGTTTVSATASDARSSVASVAIAYAASGSGTWTTICTDPTAPYGCAWDTTGVTDGAYALRAVATDAAGNSATSDTVATTVLNTASVTLTEPGDNLRGTIGLHAAISDAGSQTISALRIEYSESDAATWSTVAGCTTTAATVSCSWTPSTGTYDLRAVAVVGGRTYQDEVDGILVDNAAPSVSITSPKRNSTVSGVVSVVTNPSDADSGVDQVVVQYAQTGTTSWVTACTVGDAPYTCALDSTSVADAQYDLRAVVTDLAGNTATSATVSKVTVSNTVASVSLVNPGPFLSGSVNLTANAYSTAGGMSVSIQRSPAGKSTWTTICTLPAAPWTCSWATTGVTDGSYDLRAVLTDSKTTTTSATVTTTVANAFRGVDVQSVNRTGGTVGKMEAGDQIVFTYSGQASPSSILPGWSGTSAATVSASMSNKSSSDTFSVSGTNLGSVNTHSNLVSKSTSFYGSAMTAGTTTVNGATATVITVTLGTPSRSVKSYATAANMTWSPSGDAENLAGTTCSTGVVTESGTADKDF